MATAAQIRAKDKYRAKTYDQINIQVPKGTRDRWRALAEQEGKSLTAYIVSRVEGAYAHAEEIIDGTGNPSVPQESPSTPPEP
ncbi:MAG: Arc family DNA-binding protein [Ruminococcus flavefaciens]|nr:Arc family DNA-binding protein [Ruminococcus flavefaciens]